MTEKTGLSLWTIICLFAIIIGMVARNWNVVAIGIIAFIIGWFLRVSIGNTTEVK